MSTRKKKDADSSDEALHEATHGQFGKEPRPEPAPPADEEKEQPPQNPHQADQLKAARKKSRTV